MTSRSTRIIQSDTARRHMAERHASFNSLPFAPRPFINFRALGWMAAVVALCAALLGILAIGAK